MGKALGIAMALVLLFAPAVEASGKLRLGAEETVLRLHDLPPGYEIGFDDGCEALELTGVRRLKALDRWIASSRPERCRFEYERRFQVPGSVPAPPQLDAEMMNTRSAGDAAEGTRIFLRLLHRLTRWQPRGTVSLGPDAPIAALFRLKEGRWHVSLLFWQHGKLISSIEAAGDSPEANDEAALHYAQIQQRHLESPSPYTDAERDDTEVELDDPSLELPVYWLGPVFEPGNGFPAAELQTARVIEGSGLPGLKLELRYDGFNLETWTPSSWERFQDSYFRKINHPRCTRNTAFEWEQGHAVISAGYSRRTFDKGCPGYPPTRYWAVAHIGGVVVGVNQTTCRCLSPGFGPYSESLRGMKAILRNLTLRPKPVYGATP